MTRCCVILLCLFFTAPSAWSQGVSACDRQNAAQTAAEVKPVGCCASNERSDVAPRPVEHAPVTPCHEEDCDNSLACCCVKTLVDAPRIGFTALAPAEGTHLFNYTDFAALPAHLNRLKRPPKTQTASA